MDDTCKAICVKYVLRNHYKIVEKIGSGGFGTVFIVRKRHTRRKFFACKINTGKRSDYEYNIMRQLNHRNILRVYEGYSYCGREFETDKIKIPDAHIFTMQLCCYDLRTFCRERQPVTFNMKRLVMIDVMKGLAYLNHCRLIHCDLKPDNILLDWYGIVKISDFGAAQYSVLGVRKKTHFGTLYYRAPELLIGYEYYGLEVDIWSLGCIAAELFIGDVLFFADNEAELLSRIYSICGFFSVGFQTRMFRLYLREFVVKPKCSRTIMRLLRSTDIPEDLCHAINMMLVMDPFNRPDVFKLLKLPCFYDAIENPA